MAGIRCRHWPSACCGARPWAGIATVTRASPRRPAQQRLRPAAEPGLGELGREWPVGAGSPSPNGRITTTPRPRSAASGRILLLGLAFPRVERHLDRVDAAGSHDPLEHVECAVGWKVVAPSQRTLPTPRSRSIHSRCSRQARRLWTWSRSIRPAYQPSCRVKCLRPSATELVQTLVATKASRRRSPSAAEEDGLRPAVHRRAVDDRAPASSVVVTTASAAGWRAGGRSNIRQVPRPTTGRSMPVRPNGRGAPPRHRSRRTVPRSNSSSSRVRPALKCVTDGPDRQVLRLTTAGTPL